jgi:hypothetical protein
MAMQTATVNLQELQIPALVEDQAFYFDAELHFDRPELNQLYDIWRSKTKHKKLASRADFDARTMKPFMRHLVILDVEWQEDGSRRYRNRYTGSAVVEVFGEQTGRHVDEYIPPDRLPRWKAGHDAVVLAKRPLRAVINYNSPQISYLRSEIFCFPVSDDPDGRVNMLLGFNYFSPKRT